MPRTAIVFERGVAVLSLRRGGCRAPLGGAVASGKVVRAVKWTQVVLRGFEVIDVSDWVVLSQEQAGDDPKDWITSSAGVGRLSRADWWLFKPGKSGKRKLRGGTQWDEYRRHDDSAERIATGLAGLMGLPAAATELAQRGPIEGVISRNFIPDGWERHGGDVLLSEIPGYLSCLASPRPKERVGHTLENIRAVLDGLAGPPGTCGDMPAFDVFIGYLIFDAWIANTDRHAMNWAVLEAQNDGTRRLAPAFDHGTALASGSPDEDLERLDPLSFCAKGRAGRFEGGKSISLVDFALDGVRMADQHSGRLWLDRLAAVDAAEVMQLLAATPRVSEVRRSFLARMLMVNRRRLLQ